MVGIYALRLEFGPQGWYMDLEAEIWAGRLGGDEGEGENS